jgi:hypothetical protein
MCIDAYYLELAECAYGATADMVDMMNKMTQWRKNSISPDLNLQAMDTTRAAFPARTPVPTVKRSDPYAGSGIETCSPSHKSHTPDTALGTDVLND